MPEAIAKIPLKVFLLGILWAAISACAPVGLLIWDWTANWDDPLDLSMIGRQALLTGGMGAYAFYRKHRALLQLPPEIEAAAKLAKQKEDESVRP
jgi:hypothetical protein